MSETKMISIPGLPVEYQGATVRITPGEDAKSRWAKPLGQYGTFSMRIGQFWIESVIKHKIYHTDGSISIYGNAPLTTDETREVLRALHPRYGPRFFSFRPFRKNDYEFGFSVIAFGFPIILRIAKKLIICSNPNFVASADGFKGFENVCKIGGSARRAREFGCDAHRVAERASA